MESARTGERKLGGSREVPEARIHSLRLATYCAKKLMKWQEKIAVTISPGTLSGITLGDWLRLLADNRFVVEWPYWLRAGAITWCSAQNSLFAWYERLRYDQAIRAIQPSPPLFILGIWRSGTT